VIGRLGPSFIRPGRKRGRVVLGAPANDHHALATALVSDVLRGRGFSVTDLGAHTPSDSFIDAIRGGGRLVGIGMVVSTPLPDTELAATVAAIKAADDALLLLGGVAIRDASHAFGLGADAWSNSSRDAVDWFDATAGTQPATA
jgi:methanogenic corrinoid protein MtbC1